MRSQKVVSSKKKAPPAIVDNRPLKAKTDLSVANQPVRTVHLVEVGDMTMPQMQLMMKKLAESHSTAKDGVHFILPVRHGKLGSDVLFEQEWEAVVREMFEVRDGVISLKDGAKETMVIRQRI